MNPRVGRARWRELLVAGMITFAMLVTGLTAGASPAAANETLPGAGGGLPGGEETPLSDARDAGGATGTDTDGIEQSQGLNSGGSQTRNGDLPQYLNVQKNVNGFDQVTLSPGEEFEYKIQVSCSQQPCVDAKAVDQLPDLHGFVLEDYVGPEQPSVITWRDKHGTEISPAPQPGFVLSEGDYFEVEFLEPIGAGVGLNYGQTAMISLFLSVPDDFSPLDERNNEELENVVIGTAEGTQTKEARATIVVNAEVKVAVGVAKTWLTDAGKAEQPFSEGAASKMELRVWNASNVPVDRLVLSDPVEGSLPDGATALSDGNPFRYVDFAGFASSTLPDNASGVKVDAYVWDGTSWNWVEGAGVGPTPELPAGVDNENVGGLRFTYVAADGAQFPAGSAYSGRVGFEVTQRATERNTGSELALSSAEISALNVAGAKSALGTGETEMWSEPKEAQAPFKFTPPSLATSITKTITPAEVSKGSDAGATISASNDGSAVETWTVSDLNFFDGNASGWVRNFGGFTSFGGCPAGAQSGTVTFHLHGGTTEEVVLDCANPVIPSASNNALVTGFVFEFKSTAGKNEIPTGAAFHAAFDIKTNPDANIAVKDGKTNKAVSKGTSSSGRSVEAEDTADLTVWEPGIDLEQKKRMLPSNTAVLPGQPLIAELETTATPTVQVGVKEIVVTDEWDGTSGDFWNAFNLTEILPTVVPNGYQVTVNVKPEGGDWAAITTGFTDNPLMLEKADFAAAVNAALPGKLPADLVGIEFVFTALDGVGSPSGSVQVKPYLGFVARGVEGEVLRDGADVPEARTNYTNTVYGQAWGVPPFGDDVESDRKPATDIGPVVKPVLPDPGPEPGTSTYLAKSWNKNWVVGLTGDSRTTTLRWNVGPGNERVTLTDPGDPIGNVEDSVFNAFNLTGINSRSASNTPYSNGWYLKWDTITAIEIYDGAAWVEVNPPGGSWQSSSGGFKGMSLSEEQQAAAVGLRITLEPNDDARNANWASSAPDMNAPRAGEGVASGIGAPGTNLRSFVLNWQVRDKARDENTENPWVTGQRPYNETDDEGNPVDAVVRNDVELRGFDADNDQRFTLDASAPITILDGVAKVDVEKTVSPTGIVVPEPGAIPAENYPTASYAIKANNALGPTPGTDSTATPSRAQWVRVVDPNLCVTGLDACLVDNTAAGAMTNPFTSEVLDAFTLADEDPFNWLNVTGLTLGTSKLEQINVAGSKVFLLYYEGGAFVTGEGSFDPGTGAVSAGPSHEMSDVVGFAVVFVSNEQPGPAGGGGMITKDNDLTVKVDTQLRTTYRNNVEGLTRVEPGQTLKVENTVYSQLIRPEGVGPTDKAQSSGEVDLELRGEIIDVNPTKTIAPGVLYEPTAKVPVTVTLDADQGTESNASPKEVWLEDHRDGDFWEYLNFVGLKGVTAPAGSDQLLIEVHTAAGWEDRGQIAPADWATWALPEGVAAEDVDGLKFTFTRADGKVFSDTNDPNWAAQVEVESQLRDRTRSTDTPITFPHTGITNWVYAKSTGQYATSEEKKDDDELKLEQGSRQIAIGKLANEGSRRTTGGRTLPWDIVVENVGTGYVTLEEIEDDLSSVKLVYTGETDTGEAPWTFEGPAGIDEPTLVNEGGEGKLLKFEFAEGTRLAPKEQVSIRIYLQLQTPVSANEKIQNTIEVFTDPAQPLDEENGVIPYLFPEFSNPGAKEDDVEQTGADSGEAWDYLQIRQGLAAQVYKGVAGALGGGENISDPERTCGTFTGLDGRTYLRSPCVADSKQGGVDNWVLRVSNAGTSENWTNFWVFDALSSPGDLMIVDGVARGSEFRPVLTGMPEFLMNEHVNEEILAWVQMWVTYSDTQVCKDTWNTLPWPDEEPADPSYWDTNGPCTQNGEEWISVGKGNEDPSNPAWVPAAVDVDWEKVTGLRVHYHDHDQTHVFSPGAVIDLSYTTRNLVQGAESVGDLGSANTVPIPRDELAWNQFGTSFRPEDHQDGFPDRIAPNKVGTRLLQGSIQVGKTVAAPQDYPYLPAEITATMTCVASDAAGGVNLEFADPIDSGDPTSRKITLTWDDDKKEYTPVRVHGLPIDSTCTITEDGVLGEFGEAERDPGSVEITASQPDTKFGEDGIPTNDVPERQVGNLGNTYQWASLEVTKQVTTAADRGTFGPFDFELSCQTSDGLPVTFPGEGGAASDKATFTLERDETWIAPESTIPWGSTCTLTETNRGDAANTVITGDNVTDNEDGSATIKVTGTEDDPAAVVSTLVDNHFPAGTLTVEKAVEGDGVETYGTGEFAFTASCVYNGEELLAEDEQEFTLRGGEDESSKSFGVFPAGTVCTVVETDSDGAHETTLDPEDGKITIAGPAEGEEAIVGNVTVSATNRFDVGGLDIHKVIDGPGAEKYGAGPFTVQATCTYQVNDETREVELPGDGVVELSEANEYTAHFDDIYVGAECVVAELDAAGAHETTLDPEDGVIVVGTSGNSVVVTITNTFNVGSLEIIKKVTGAGAAEKGAGPFEAQVSCTYEQGDELLEVALPNGGKVVLSKDNNFRSTIDGIYAGAECTVVETEDGGADRTEIGPNKGQVNVAADETVTVTITNTFGKLPVTGAQVAGLTLGAALLIGAGLLLHYSTRRRGRHA